MMAVKLKSLGFIKVRSLFNSGVVTIFYLMHPFMLWGGGASK